MHRFSIKYALWHKYLSQFWTYSTIFFRHLFQQIFQFFLYCTFFFLVHSSYLQTTYLLYEIHFRIPGIKDIWLLQSREKKKNNNLRYACSARVSANSIQSVLFVWWYLLLCIVCSTQSHMWNKQLTFSKINCYLKKMTKTKYSWNWHTICKNGLPTMTRFDYTFNNIL